MTYATDSEGGSVEGAAMEERCALSAAIRTRLRRFAEDDDAAAILGAEADQECTRLLNLSVEDEALDLIASLQWTKTLIALDESSGGDWRPDEELGWELYRGDATRLHPRMRDVLMLDPWPVHGPDLARDTELGCELLESAQSGGDGEVLRRAVLLFRGIVSVTRSGDPALVPRLSNLGAALATRFEFFGARGDLAEALSLGREAVRLADPDDDELSRHLSNLASALATGYELDGADQDLDEAVLLARQAVECIKSPDHRAAGYLSNLSAVLEMRYSRVGDRAALDESVETARQAVQASVGTYGPADRAGYLTNLCNALMLRFRRDGLNDDLNEAVEAALSTADLAPVDHPDRHLHLTNVANVLATRFEAHGDAGDLDRAIEAGRGAVEATRPGHPFHSRYLSNLGGLSLTRFALSEDPPDLNAAVEASAEAVGHAADGHGERAAYLTNLGNALLTRFEHGGTRADLTDGVLAHREAVDRTPADHPHRIRRLINLCTTARLRFTVEARSEDLDLAIGAGREAAAGLPSGHPERPAAFTNLASALHARFERLHTAGDLGQAVELSRTAVKESAAEHPWRIRRLVNLAAVLRSRFGHSGSFADLQEAVDVLREAVEILDDDPTQQAALWGALGNTLLTDTATRTDDELSEAVEAHRRAVAVTPARHVHRRARLINLSAAHAARFARTAEQRDLNQAIRRGRQAIATPGAGTDPDDARYLSNLGVLLRTRYELTGADADRKAALRSWRRSASSELGAASIRVGAAYSWGELARESDDLKDALDGYSTAVRLQARLAWRGADRATREGNLGPWSGLACDAAACALEAGMPERAVELLEEGRSVLWAQTLQTRGDLTALGEAHPDEAERLGEIRRLLDHHEATANRQAGETAPAGPEEGPTIEFTQALARDERIRLAQEWDGIVGRVRRFEGFANFLVPTPFAELAPAADQGDVVMVNVSRFRCDALILTARGLRVVALPELRVEVLAEVAAAYVGMLRMTRDYERLPADRRYRLTDGMREVLRWLWTVIAAPVLDALGLQHRDRDWPRLWWCPTGLLGLLPLHAAQEYDAERMCDSGVPDRVISSFTPTLGRLLAARAAEPEDLANRRALVVGLSETPRLPALPNVDRELDAIAPHLTMPTTRLRDSAATWQDVTTQLPDHSWLHYAGHSGQYPNRPGMATLFLYDRRLTAVQIADLDLRRVAFAFLSSCESGLGDTALPDEALQLAAALQVAGYRQIIATLWSIGDEVAPSVAAAVYAALDGAPKVEAAQALHNALHPVRSGHRPLAWAGYCHVGI